MAISTKKNKMPRHKILQFGGTFRVEVHRMILRVDISYDHGTKGIVYIFHSMNGELLNPERYKKLEKEHPKIYDEVIKIIENQFKSGV